MSEQKNNADKIAGTLASRAFKEHLRARCNNYHLTFIYLWKFLGI